jgi:hypothetical protein
MKAPEEPPAARSRGSFVMLATTAPGRTLPPAPKRPTGRDAAADAMAKGAPVGQFLIYLIIDVLFAVACAYIAKGKGRSMVLWAILGFLFPLIALIIVAVLPRSKPAVSAASAAPTYAPSPPPPPPAPEVTTQEALAPAAPQYAPLESAPPAAPATPVTEPAAPPADVAPPAQPAAAEPEAPASAAPEPPSVPDAEPPSVAEAEPPSVAETEPEAPADADEGATQEP